MMPFADFEDSGKIFTVSGLTDLIRRDLESRYPFVWVRGEVADYSISSSRHIYFSLRDGASLLQCVWFAGRRTTGAGCSFDPLTGEVYDAPKPHFSGQMRDGMEIVCAGSINVYAKSGRYQLVVEHAEPAGQGLEALAFEQLKAKLEKAGYFASARKRKLPVNPVRVALITSPHGAAIHDFMTLAETRGLSARIRLYPVPVQGMGAADRIARAIKLANGQKWAQVIVLVRGGGSSADLREFNEEALATAIFESAMPVLAGIGHEVDFSLADMTADMRAATPSHAAQLLWPLRREIWQKLDELDMALERLMSRRLEYLEKDWLQKTRALNWLSPMRKLQRLMEKNRDLDTRLRNLGRNFLSARTERLQKGVERVKRASGLRQKMAFSEHVVNSALISVRNAFGACITGLETELRRRQEKGARAWSERVGLEESRLRTNLLLLDNRNPLLPLRRGYALLRNSNGLVKSVTACAPGDLVNATLLDGSMLMAVKNIFRAPDKS